MGDTWLSGAAALCLHQAQEVGVGVVCPLLVFPSVYSRKKVTCLVCVTHKLIQYPVAWVAVERLLNTIGVLNYSPIVLKEKTAL